MSICVKYPIYVHIYVYLLCSIRRDGKKKFKEVKIVID